MKIFFLLATALFSTISFATVPGSIDVKKISKGMHVLSGKEYGTNIGVLSTGKSIILIDPMPGADKSLLDDLDKTISDIYKEAPIFILNTHGHEDHTGGNDYFTQKGGQFYKDKLGAIGIEHVVVYSHFSEDNIYYHKKSNSIFVGDVFDASWHPTFYFGGVKGFISAIDTILKLGNKQSLIIPGHGKLSSKKELSEFRDNTLEWVSRLKTLLVKKYTVEEIMADHKAHEILQRFNVDNRAEFLPKRAIVRFIERTITVIENES